MLWTMSDSTSLSKRIDASSTNLSSKPFVYLVQNNIQPPNPFFFHAPHNQDWLHSLDRITRREARVDAEENTVHEVETMAKHIDDACKYIVVMS